MTSRFLYVKEAAVPNGGKEDFYMLQADNKSECMCHTMAMEVCLSDSTHVIASVEDPQDPILTSLPCICTSD